MVTTESEATAGPSRHPVTPPPATVLAAFGASEPPIRVPHGRGQTWVAGRVVLKPTDDVDEANWLADVSLRIQEHGFRVPRPIAAHDGRWVVDGWVAWTRVTGEHSNTRWPELLAAADAFHAAIATVPKPDFIDRRSNRWRIADRIAWGNEPADAFAGIAHLDRLLRARRPLDLPSQLVHGDLVGNVLFSNGQPPAILDLSLYWRPLGYSAALVVGDALAWEGATLDLVQLLHRFEQWPQLLLRAVIFRIVVNALARRAEPWRAELASEYQSVVEFALSRARDPRP